MEVTMEPKDSILYKKAKKKAREIRSFYISLMCYCIVMPVLIFINLQYTPEFYWFIFSMLGWGMGLLFHGMSAFGWNPFLGKDWEEKKLKQFMDEEESKHKKYKQ